MPPLTRTIPAAICMAAALLAGPCAAQELNLPSESDAAGAQIAETPAFKALIANYIAAVNSKNREKLTACLDPASQALMARDKDAANRFFEGAFDDHIPAKHDIVVSAIPPTGALPGAGMGVTYAERPSIQVQINYSTDQDQDGTIIFLAMTGGKWFEVYNTPADEKKLEQAFSGESAAKAGDGKAPAIPAWCHLFKDETFYSTFSLQPGETKNVDIPSATPLEVGFDTNVTIPAPHDAPRTKQIPVKLTDRNTQDSVASDVGASLRFHPKDGVIQLQVLNRSDYPLPIVMFTGGALTSSPQTGGNGTVPANGAPKKKPSFISWGAQECSKPLMLPDGFLVSQYGPGKYRVDDMELSQGHFDCIFITFQPTGALEPESVPGARQSPLNIKGNRFNWRIYKTVVEGRPVTRKEVIMPNFLPRQKQGNDAEYIWVRIDATSQEAIDKLTPVAGGIIRDAD